MLRRDVLLAGSLAWLPFRSARAAGLVFGINAEVSYRESEPEVRRRYTPLLDHLSQAAGRRMQFKPVYSDQVDRALKEGGCDCMLIHTHAALRAERERGWQILGFTEDRSNDVVHFFVRPDSPITHPGDIAAHPIGSPGLQSWAVATARSALRRWSPSTQLNFVTTKLQDAVPLMVELKRAPVGISRSQKVVADYVRQNRLRVVHSTAALPLNAIIASPDTSASLIADLREELQTERNPTLFEDLGFKGVRYSGEEAQRLRTFYG